MTTHGSLIIAPSSFEEVLRELASFEEEEFGYLVQEIRGRDAFDVSSLRCKRMAIQLRRTPETIAFTLRALGFVYVQLSEIDQYRVDIRKVVDDFIRSFDFPMDEDTHRRLVERIVVLCSQSSETDAAIRFQELRRGFLDNLTSVDSYVDLRPDFNADKTKIQSLVPVVQLRLLTNSVDPRLREIIVQVDEETIGMLSAEIEQIKLSLAALTGLRLDA